ncbi:casein kinase II subunit alpha (CSK21) [Vairimorpha necatrix]|uniref:Casein kinase II subunit alpha n=1 Tax=Vairimorpha necatrix TaxID=6039 RepID=A0AAX4JG91_9MICR
MLKSTPRENKEVNEVNPESYYNYEEYKIKTGNIDKYKIAFRLGRGKYSEVFEGRTDNDRVVIKLLKPVRESKINREILILKNLNHDNIIKLEDVVMDKDSSTYSLIFKYIKHDDTIKLFETFDINDIRFYSRQILKALSYAHSRGIMHRDIKPHNIIINQKEKKLLLIDWGLAEFYHPNKDYSVRVASRYYKSPELLLNYPYYNYSLDIWSFGCVFAEMMYKKRPLFKGEDNNDQLLKIAKCLGREDLETYSQKYDIDIFNGGEVPSSRIDFEDFLMVKSKDYKLAVDLLNKILVYDHIDRYTADECLNHPFFNKTE